MSRPSAVVRRWVEAFDRADSDAPAELDAEDAVNHSMTFEPAVGREVGAAH